MNQKELSQVYYLNRELKARENQLNDLIQASQIKSPQISGMPFANTNEINDKVAETAVKIIEYTEMVNVYREALVIRKKAIDEWIMSLEDSVLKQIIYYRCIELMSWTKVAMMMGGGNTPDGCRMYFNRKIPKK